jgi:hypothetical protein
MNLVVTVPKAKEHLKGSLSGFMGLSPRIVRFACVAIVQCQEQDCGQVPHPCHSREPLVIPAQGLP